MTAITSNKISTFGIVSQAEQEILKSENETQEASKTSIETNRKYLEHKRQERIDNLEERIRMLGKGHGGGCFKFLKIIAIVASAITAPFTGGASLTVMALVIAVLNSVANIVEGLEKLKQALKQKEITLNQAEGQQILAIINETSKWIEDEKQFLDDSNRREKESFNEYHQTLKDLEKSFETMIRV